MKFEFYKYQGAGNDFVMIDNRNNVFDGSHSKLIEFICHRRFGVGADGLMTLENIDGYDFKMTYFNLDGFEASMCGNGGRCIVAFAKHLGIIKDETIFLAADGPHKAIIENRQVNLQMTNVSEINALVDGYSLNTGVPHLVHFVSDLHNVDVNLEGRQLRFDARFQPEGTNVNFVQEDGDNLTVYTYERGVESETFACGTGVTAAALSAAYKSGKDEGRYYIQAKGGKLEVQYKREKDHFSNIWLKGPAELVYQGKVNTEGFEEILK